MKTKQQKAWLRGRILEEVIYNKIKTFLESKNQINGNYHHVYLDRPVSYEGKQYHDKKRIEIDNMFFLNNRLYVIQAKYRKGVDDNGKDNCFWLPTKKANDIWLDGKKVTGLLLDNLWKAKQYIKYNKIYKFHHFPEIRTILVIGSKLKIDSHNSVMGYVRDTYVVSIDFFDQFLKILDEHTSLMDNKVPQEERGRVVLNEE